MKLQPALLAIIIVFSSLLSAQSNFEWEQIENTKIQIVNITSEVNLYGFDTNRPDLYYSENNILYFIEIIGDKYNTSTRFIKT